MAAKTCVESSHSRCDFGALTAPRLEETFVFEVRQHLVQQALLRLTLEQPIPELTE